MAGNCDIPYKNKIKMIEIVGLTSDFQINKTTFNTNIDFVIKNEIMEKTTSIKLNVNLEINHEWKLEVYKYF